MPRMRSIPKRRLSRLTTPASHVANGHRATCNSVSCTRGTRATDEPIPTIVSSPVVGRPNWRTSRGWMRLVWAPVSARARIAQASLRTVRIGSECGRNDAHSRGICYHGGPRFRVLPMGEQGQHPAVSVRTPELLKGVGHRISSHRHQSVSYRFPCFVLSCHLQKQPDVHIALFPFLGREFFLSLVLSEGGITQDRNRWRRHKMCSYTQSTVGSHLRAVNV